MRKKLFFLGIILFSLTIYGCKKQINNCIEGGDICKDGSPSFVEQKNEEIDGEDIIKRTKNIESIEMNKQFPDRVSELGIMEPSSMKLLSSESSGSYLFQAQYQGDYDIALSQAETIANIAGIPINEDFEAAKQSSSTYKSFFGDMNGILYTNYSLLSHPDSKYEITISVDENGILLIKVKDRENLE